MIDASTDTVVKELPLLYKGAGCTETIVGTAAATNEPGHIAISADGRSLFVAIGGGFMVGRRPIEPAVAASTSAIRPIPC